ncbi:hypothetical protein [Nonomuraea rosea]
MGNEGRESSRRGVSAATEPAPFGPAHAAVDERRAIKVPQP